MRHFPVLLILLVLAPSTFAQTLFGPERQLTPPDPVPAAFDQRDASVATDGSGFLVAWTSGVMPGYASLIAASHVDSDGTVIDPTPVVIDSSGLVGPPAAAFGVDRYLVAWSTPGSIHARAVTSDGDLSPPVSISVSDGGGLTASCLRAAWDGSRFLIAWTYASFGQVRRGFALLDPSGNAITSKTFFVGTASVDFGVVAGTDEFILVDAVLDSMSVARAFRIDDSGTVAGPITIFAGNTPLASARVAFNGSEYLVVASSDVTVSGQSLVARLKLDNTVIAATPFYSGGETISTLTWTGNEYLATLSDATHVDAVHLDSTGSVSSPLKQLITGQSPYASDAAWNGGRLLIALNVAGDVFEDFLNAPQPVALSPALQYEPDIKSAGGGDALVVWYEQDSGTSFNAVALPLHNGVPSAPAVRLGDAFVSPVLAWSGDEYLAVWRAAAGLVGVRLDRGGRPLDGQPIVIDAVIPEVGSPAVSFDGENFIVAYETGAACGTHGTTFSPALRRVTRAGTVLDSTPIAAGGQTCGTVLSLASGPEGSLLTWTGTTGEAAAFITHSGSTGAVSLWPMLTGHHVRAVWAGSQFIVVDLSSAGLIEWLTVSANGFPMAHDIVPITITRFVSWSSFNDLLFVWSDNGTNYGLRFSPDGFPIGNPFAIPSSGHAQSIATADGEAIYAAGIDFPSVPWITRLFIREIEFGSPPPRRRAVR